MSKNEVIFINNCCASGYRAFRDYQKAHPTANIKRYSYLRAYHAGLHELYNFEIESLKKYSYIVEEDGTVLKFKN